MFLKSFEFAVPDFITSNSLPKKIRRITLQSLISIQIEKVNYSLRIRKNLLSQEDYTSYHNNTFVPNDINLRTARARIMN